MWLPLRRAWAQLGGGDGEQHAVCVQAATEKRQQDRRRRGGPKYRLNTRAPLTDSRATTRF